MPFVEPGGRPRAGRHSLAAEPPRESDRAFITTPLAWLGCCPHQQAPMAGYHVRCTTMHHDPPFILGCRSRVAYQADGRPPRGETAPAPLNTVGVLCRGPTCQRRPRAVRTLPLRPSRPESPASAVLPNVPPCVIPAGGPPARGPPAPRAAPAPLLGSGGRRTAPRGLPGARHDARPGRCTSSAPATPSTVSADRARQLYCTQILGDLG